MVFLKEYFQIKYWVPYDQRQRQRMMVFVLWSILVAGILLGLVNLYLKAIGAGLILFALSLSCIAGLRLKSQWTLSCFGLSDQLDDTDCAGLQLD